MSTKKAFFIAIVAGVVGGLVQGLVSKPRYSLDSTPEFFSVTCKQLWVVDDEGKTGMLLSVNDEGGFMHVNGIGADTPDYQKAITLTIEETGGVLRVSGTEGSILATDDGIRVYGEDHITITGSLPHHPHPHQLGKLDKERSK